MKKNMVLKVLIFVMFSFILTACSININFRSNEINNQKVNIFKSTALTAFNASEDLYSEMTMSTNVYNQYKTSGSNGNYSALCFTVKGLVDNSYLNKDPNEYKGLFLVEIPNNGEPNKYVSWYRDENFAIVGIEKDLVNKLSYSSNSNNVAVTNDFSEIDDLLNKIENNEALTLTSNRDKGGTGETYTDIKCVNGKVRYN